MTASAVVSSAVLELVGQLVTFCQSRSASAGWLLPAQ